MQRIGIGMAGMACALVLPQTASGLVTVPQPSGSTAAERSQPAGRPALSGSEHDAALSAAGLAVTHRDAAPPARTPGVEVGPRHDCEPQASGTAARAVLPGRRPPCPAGASDRPAAPREMSDSASLALMGLGSLCIGLTMRRLGPLGVPADRGRATPGGSGGTATAPKIRIAPSA